MQQPLAQTPVTALKGVGAKVAEKLTRLGLATVQDVLFHLPLRYEDRTRIYPISDLQPGTHISVEADVMQADIQFGRRRMLVVRVSDGSGTLTLRFFHFGAAQKNSFVPGARLRCFGEVRRGRHGLEMAHPEYRLLSEIQSTQLDDSYTPIYPTTEGLKQLSLRNISEQALTMLDRGALAELLPAGFYEQQMTLHEALHLVHRPGPEVSLELLENGQHPAQKRLILEELLAHHLSVLKLRQTTSQYQAYAMSEQPSALLQAFLANLPFSPTGAQKRVYEEIVTDFHQPHPMMRLVQGDVGSGKTLVAAMAALCVINQGYQVAMMAPTELLAEQHANNFANWLQPLGVNVGWLGGKIKGKPRQALLDSMAKGQCQFIVGTHALFQDDVAFHKLALVVIDEQHRFGVHQRLALREKGQQGQCAPHQLIMTATPIPRTLAMTAYADLDTSIIDELPPGRTPVKTVALPDSRRQEIIERVRHACTQEQRQVYWVCTLIEESDVLQCQAAEDTAELLIAALPELRVGLVHGRLKAAEKQHIMNAFKEGELDLLVATTVIEVGVDVPNASLMVLENPERLGLAQLHQLRGRVGRGSVESHCVLMYQAPLSKTASKRLGVLRQSNDGFYIAQQDLEIRGPGELLGTRQTGLANLKIADLVRDAHLIPQVQELAQRLWQSHPAQAQAMINRWLPYREDYGNA